LLRINRPEAKNAINTAVAHGIEEALDDIEGDPVGARRRAHRHGRRLRPAPI
jgi:enoyl-CoA hydratase/carnithine racemase